MGGGAYLPRDFDPRECQEVGQPWTATTFSLSQLREFGLDPTSGRAKRTVELLGVNSHWEEGGQPYWEGEVEECINGRIVADGAYFGVDVSSIVDRLVGERLEWKGFSSTRESPEARRNPERRASRVRRISWSATSSAVSARVNQLMRGFCVSCIRTVGTTTSCVGSTISAPLRCLPKPIPISDSARLSTTYVPNAWGPALGPSIGAQQGECGSRLTTDRASPRGG
jgi:hypothetical protein